MRLHLNLFYKMKDNDAVRAVGSLCECVCACVCLFVCVCVCLCDCVFFSPSLSCCLPHAYSDPSDMTHSDVCRDSFICSHSYVLDHLGLNHGPYLCWTRLARMCDMTHSYVWHNSFIWFDDLIVSFETHSHVRHDSSTCLTWLIYTCDICTCEMTHTYVWHDSLYVCRDSFIWLDNLIFNFEIYSYVWHDAFTGVTWLIHTRKKTDACMCDMTHAYVWRDSLHRRRSSFIWLDNLTFNLETHLYASGRNYQRISN